MNRPAFLVAVGIVLGIVAWHASAGFLAIALILLAVSAIAVFLFRRGSQRTALITLSIAACAAGYSLGALALGTDEQIGRAMNSAIDSHEHLFYATVDNDPTPVVDGVAFDAVLHALRDSSGTHPLGGGRVRVFCASPPGASRPELRRGTRLAIYGRLRAEKSVRNPGDADFAGNLRAQGVLGDLAVRSVANMDFVGIDEPSIITLWIENVRHHIARALDRFVGGEEGNILKGLLIGERGEIGETTRESFAVTGTFHVLAVSGLHVAYVALLLYGVFSPVLNRYVHTGLLMTALLSFSVLAGGPPSIWRAVLMAVLVLAAGLLERRIDPLNLVGGAACLLLVVDPSQVFAAGFPLSFTAAIGLAFFMPRLRALVIRGSFAKHGPLQWSAELACASIAAQCATLPLTALYFERISPAGIIANLFVVPASAVALGFASLVAIASPAAWLAQLLGDGARAYMEGFLWLTCRIAAVPYASIAVAPFSVVQIGLYYASAFFVFGAVTPTQVVKRIAIVAVGIVAFVLSPLEQTTLFRPDALTVVALDVGQGDGMVVCFPNGRIMVVDAGPPKPMQLAALPVSAFLLRQHIRHVEALVVTHLHADHIGGAVDLMKRIRVDSLFHSGERADDVRVHELDSATTALDIPKRTLHDGELIAIDPSVRVYVLHPDSIAVDSTGATGDGNLNNGSVVLKIQYGATSILLSGDLEGTREAALVARYGAFLRSDILKTGHHGSKTSTTADYLSSVRPSVAIVSVGENHFGHPSPAVLARLRAAEISIDRTDDEGAVVWQSDGLTWKKLAWR